MPGFEDNQARHRWHGREAAADSERATRLSSAGDRGRAISQNRYSRAKRRREPVIGTG
jgi:hypothetical protein